MYLVDWGIILVAGFILILSAVFTKKYVQSVADFLAANRCAGRYLISLASLSAGFSTLSYVGHFEGFLQAGLTPIWWQLMFAFQAAIVGL